MRLRHSQTKLNNTNICVNSTIIIERKRLKQIKESTCSSSAIFSRRPYSNKRCSPPKSQLNFTRLHGVIYQKIELTQLVLLLFMQHGGVEECTNENICVVFNANKNVLNREQFDEIPPTLGGTYCLNMSSEAKGK
jgi:hypothetical protein